MATYTARVGDRTHKIEADNIQVGKRTVALYSGKGNPAVAIFPLEHVQSVIKDENLKSENSDLPEASKSRVR